MFNFRSFHSKAFNSNPLKNSLIKTFLILSLFITHSAQATTVQFVTSSGDFEVNLYDNKTPKTVANFLAYVEAGDYSNVIFHRSVSNFVIQGGGFVYSDTGEIINVNNRGTVVNEPIFSNVRGTIAMAKLATDPDSASNQWFFNLGNNSGNLDSQNSGFTVFGEVNVDGMAIIDQIAALPKVNLDGGGVFSAVPLQNYDTTNTPVPDETNYIIISSIQVTDRTVDTAPADIPLSTNTPPSDGGGGGSMGGVILGLIMLLGLRRKK